MQRRVLSFAPPREAAAAPMLFVHQSNRIETLAAGLAQRMLDAPLAPLEPETILVESTATRRWLALALAERLGVAANLRFAFPAAYVWQLIGAVVPDVPRESPFDPERLVWRLLPRLAEARRDPASESAADGAFAPVARFLADGDPVKPYELAARLAAAFDDYIAYRPDWIEAWSANRLVGLGPHERWQAALWRELAGTLPAAARTHPRRRFLAALDTDLLAPAALPPRIGLFAVDALPPPYFEVLERIARFTEVHLWLVAPCREYWGLVVDRRRIAAAAAAGDAGDALLEAGNPLLASLGRHARALFDRVADLQGVETEDFVDPLEARGSALAAIQSDVLNLRTRGVDLAPLAPDAADDSIAVHVCHGPMREVEVLHDQLLARFAADRTLRPGDVLVLVADMATYAPYVDAVFGGAPEPRRIPFSVADRGAPGGGSGVLRAFDAVLDTASGRLEAERVLALLETPAVARRFRVDAEDLAQLREWVAASGARWGADAASRARLGLPAGKEHTWRAGLERLVLGHAMAGDGLQLFAGVLPAEGVEGQEAVLVARLARFVDALARCAEGLALRRSAGEWQAFLDAQLDAFLAPGDEAAAELQAIRGALFAMADAAAEARCALPLPLAAVRMHLARSLAPASRSHGFLTGGVTFAALESGRTVPARLVCLLGVNDGALPRDPRRPGFDLVAAAPRAGDRSLREEDRHAFLAAVLAARESLYVSYTGRQLRDNAPLPPSPVVRELLDVLRATAPDRAERCVVEHPLQPFSERYFDAAARAPAARLFSYAAEYAVPRGTTAPAPRLAGRVLPGDAAPAVITLDQLHAFFANPARALLRERLDLRLETADLELEAAEPFALEQLDRWHADQRVFEALRAGLDDRAAIDVLRAEGLLPHGAPGELAAAERIEAVRRLAAAAHARESAVAVEREIVLGPPGDARLLVRLGDLTLAGLLVIHVARRKPAHRLQAWIAHLALNALAVPNIEPVTTLLDLDGETSFGPVTEPEARLAELVAIRRDGLREAVPLFPRASWAYAEALHKGRGETEALRAAQRAWAGDERRDIRGERSDAYVELAFRDGAPLDDPRFASLAVRVFAPLLESIR